MDWCSYEAAKYAVEHWHYSKTMPVNKTARIGVWEGGEFIGVLVFSCGSAGVGLIGKSFGLLTSEIAELARVALREHTTMVTRIVSLCLRLLTTEMTGLRLLISYADPAQGHIGAIYQGGNWVYTGRSAPDSAYRDHDGKLWHSRSVSETGWKVRLGIKTRCPKPSTMERVPLEPKYRYLYPLDAAMRKQIEPLRQPYPKRPPARGTLANEGRQCEPDPAAPDIEHAQDVT